MPKIPVVASYIADFLKSDQLHVYRQVTGFQEVECHIFTHNRENAIHFPYHPRRVHEMPKPRTRWLRRFIHRTLRDEPWQMYRSELRRWILSLTRVDARLLHIYFGHVAPQFLPLMKAWPHPVVVSFHGADAGVDMQKPRHLARLREVFQLADRFLCRSESLAEDIVKLGCDEKKVSLQRTGIPLEDWPYQPRTTPDDGGWRVVQACRFVDKKGLDLTLQAFATATRSLPKARLILLGDGPLLPALREQAARLGIADRVEFPGFLHRFVVKDLLYSAHIFMHPSRTSADGNREGVPNAMLEAMASGMPVTATRHGGIPEAVTDGESGLLVPENDPAALSEALGRVLCDEALRNRIAEGGRRSIEQNYARASQIQKLEACYKDLMQRPRTAQ
jgi:colanic acid/amylovoran biosynthesis glycosyltransferase